MKKKLFLSIINFSDKILPLNPKKKKKNMGIFFFLHMKKYIIQTQKKINK